MRHRPTPTARLWRGLGYGLLLASPFWMGLWWAIRYYHSFH